MGILDNVERGIERAVNGAFAKTFRARLQPLEIFSALRGELDSNTRILNRDTIVGPSEFSVHINPDDFARLRGEDANLADQFVSDLHAYADQHGYQFTGPVLVTITPDPAVSAGLVQVSSKSPSTAVDLVPVIQVAGRDFPLPVGTTTIGRSNECDITVTDAAASKRHASITWDGHAAVLNDLNSTNGTQVNGQRVAHAQLDSPTGFTVGSTQLVFRLAPKAIG